MKKFLKISLLSVLGLVIVIGVLMWLEFGPLVKGAMSAEKLDDGLYYMEYKGDDGFDKVIEQGGFESADLMAGDTILLMRRWICCEARVMANR